MGLSGCPSPLCCGSMGHSCEPLARPPRAVLHRARRDPVRVILLSFMAKPWGAGRWPKLSVTRHSFVWFDRVPPDDVDTLSPLGIY
jgi:hypothetical protein